MKKSLLVATGTALVACNLAGFAQSETACGQVLDAPLRARAVLTIHSRPAGLEVVGTDQQAIHVSCTVRDVENAADIRMKLSGNQDDSKLAITGSSLSNGNLQIRIEVPRKTNLTIQMAAGEVKVEDILGDKDIDVHAGQIVIASSRQWDYRSVDLSVDIGEVKAEAYGADKGGFFPSFKKNTADGEYGLHAHVFTGEIDLLSTKASGTPE